MHEQELLKQLKDDKVAQILDNVFKFGSLSYDDICVLKGCSENSNTLFNKLEVRWIMFNYKLWLKLVKGSGEKKLGRKIYMKFNKYAKNVHRLAIELSVPRSSVYWWVNKFHRAFLIKTKPINYYCKNTNENLLVLDRENYPFLIDITSLYIKQQIANEGLE